MTYWERNPLSFQLILIAGGIFLLVFSFYNFYINVTSPTDENLFSELNNRFYLTKGIPVKSNILIDSINRETTELIPGGSILMNINGINIKNDSTLITAFISTPDSINLKAKFLHTVNNKTTEYLIPKKDFDINKLRYIKHSVLIIDIMKDGSSERAGLMVGDIILKINDKSFKSVWEADILMKKNKSGTIVKYKILRENRELDVNVQLAKYGIQFIFLSLFLNGLIIFLLGWYIGLMRPNLNAAKMVSISLMTLGFGVSISFSLYSIEFDFVSMLRLAFLLGSVLFGIPLLFHSFYYFPKEIPEPLKNQKIFKIPYLIASIFFSVLMIMLMFFQDKSIYINLIFVVGITIIIFYFQIIRYFKFKKILKEENKIGRTIIWSANFFLLLFFVVPALSMSQIGFVQYLSLLFPILPLAYIFTIGRYRLFDLDFRLNKNIQFSIIQFIWNVAIFYLLGYTVYLISIHNVEFPNLHFNGYTIEVLDHELSATRQEMYQRIFAIIVSIFAIVVFYFVRNLILNFFRRKYDRIGLDYKSANAKLTIAMLDNYSISSICLNVTEILTEILKLKNVGIVIFQTDDAIWEQYFINLPNEELSQFHQTNSRQLFFAVSTFNGAVHSEYLPDNIKDIYIKNELQYVVPVRSKGKLVGFILIGEKLAETSFDTDEISLLNSIAAQTAISIDNSILYVELSKRERIKHELELARKIQLATLPDKTPSIQNLDISAIAMPAYEVGGDFYDYLTDSQNNLTIVIGDVSGKGTSAALIMSKAQGILRALHSFDLSPRQLLIKSNHLLQFTLNKGSFVTILATKFDINKNEVIISRAGHLPLYYFNHKKQKVQKILPKGIVIGVSPHEFFEKFLDEEKIQYECGDIFVLLTDGISESRNNLEEEFGEDKLIEIINKYKHQSADEIKNSIINEVDIFSNTSQQYDDMTLVVVKVCK